MVLFKAEIRSYSLNLSGSARVGPQPMVGTGVDPLRPSRPPTQTITYSDVFGAPFNSAVQMLMGLDSDKG